MTTPRAIPTNSIWSDIYGKMATVRAQGDHTMTCTLAYSENSSLLQSSSLYRGINFNMTQSEFIEKFVLQDMKHADRFSYRRDSALGPLYYGTLLDAYAYRVKNTKLVKIDTMTGKETPLPEDDRFGSGYSSRGMTRWDAEKGRYANPIPDFEDDYFNGIPVFVTESLDRGVVRHSDYHAIVLSLAAGDGYVFSSTGTA